VGVCLGKDGETTAWAWCGGLPEVSAGSDADTEGHCEDLTL
jgi:hypothetical protein